jgi:hypothetical protein
MKLEYLPSGSPDCPLIRFFAFHNEEPARLKTLLLSFSNHSASSVALHEVNACRLYFRIAESDEPIRSVAPGVFEYVLSGAAWDNMAELVESLCKPDATGYQWLRQPEGIQLLLSRDGGW